MSKYRAPARAVGIVAGVVVLVVGLSAGSAAAWNKCAHEGGGKEGMPTPQTSEKPGPSKGHEEQKPGHEEQKPGHGGQKPGHEEYKPPAEEQQPVTSPAVETSPPPAAPVSTGLLPGTPPVASPTLVPETTSSPTPVPEAASSPTPAPEVKGAIGTSWRADSGAPTVVAAADVQPAGLARTGADVLPLGLLAVLALGGSAFFFRRTRRC